MDVTRDTSLAINDKSQEFKVMFKPNFQFSSYDLVHMASVFAHIKAQWTSALLVLDSNRSAQLPKWLPDNKAHRCGYCFREYGILFRRHHCRLCGTPAPNNPPNNPLTTF